MSTALLLAAILFLQGAGTAQTAVFKVSGTVVREDNRPADRVPLADRVLLRSDGTPAVFVDVGEGGKFEFPSVRPGTYQLVVGPVVPMDPLPLVVTDKDVTNVRLFVPDLQSIRGTVAVEGGGPVPRFQMAFTRVDGAANPAPIAVTVVTRFTATLHSGQYRVTATGLPNGYTIKSATMDQKDVFAQPLKVDSETDSITVTLGVSSPPPWVKVSGRVTESNGAAIIARSVTMNGTVIAEPLVTAVNADRSFQFPSVLPGSYTVLALTESGPSAPLALTVGTADVTNVALRMPVPKQISGRITLQGNVPMPRLAFTVAPVGAAVPNAGRITLPANPQQDGSFRVELPEGERQIAVVPASIPAGYKLTAFAYGAIDLLKDPLKVSSTDKSDLRLTLDATSVTAVNVSGKVNGLLTTQGVRVVLMSPVFSSLEAPVSADGSFAFSKIIPGNYTLRLSLSGIAPGRTINVSNKDLTDVIITYPRQFIVSGHVIIEGGGGSGRPEVVLEAKNAAGRSTTSTMLEGRVVMLSLQDGEYNVSARTIPAGYQLKSMMYGTTDLQKSPLKIDGPVTWEVIVRLVPSPTGK